MGATLEYAIETLRSTESRLNGPAPGAELKAIWVISIGFVMSRTLVNWPPPIISWKRKPPSLRTKLAGRDAGVEPDVLAGIVRVTVLPKATQPAATNRSTNLAFDIRFSPRNIAKVYAISRLETSVISTFCRV